MVQVNRKCRGDDSYDFNPDLWGHVMSSLVTGLGCPAERTEQHLGKGFRELGNITDHDGAFFAEQPDDAGIHV